MFLSSLTVNKRKVSEVSRVAYAAQFFFFLGEGFAWFKSVLQVYGSPTTREANHLHSDSQQD